MKSQIQIKIKYGCKRRYRHKYGCKGRYKYRYKYKYGFKYRFKYGFKYRFKYIYTFTSALCFVKVESIGRGKIANQKSFSASKKLTV